MANEIQLAASLTAQRLSGGAITATVTGSCQALATLVDSDMGSATQSFTTSAAAVLLAGVTSPGYLFVKNTSATGNLLLYLDEAKTQRITTLKPGEGIPIPAPAAMWGASSAETVVAHIVAVKA